MIVVNVMRASYLFALVLTVVGAGTYWYQSSAAMCPVPLSYRIGEIDPSFEITVEEAKRKVAEAEELWELSANRELFVYDDLADFTINFIYDDRQETANLEGHQREVLDAEWEKSEQVVETVESLQEEHRLLGVSYEARVAEYEKRLDVYNKEVSKYNDRGGAPADVFEKLEIERKELERESKSLSDIVSELNAIAAQINKLSERANQMVTDYNAGVEKYNKEFGFAREFTQGDYQGGQINVYKFSTDTELVSVLAHEFGHALGIDHVEGEDSLMYYLLEDTGFNPKLSRADIVAYQEVCGESETWEQSLRRTVREFLAKF